MKNKLLLIAAFLTSKIYAQSITIQPGSNADPVIFKIENQATGNKVRALELPVVTTEQRQKYPNPKSGTTVFDIDSKQICTFQNISLFQNYWVGSHNIFQVPNPILPNFVSDGIGYGNDSDIGYYYDKVYNTDHRFLAVAAPNDASSKGAVFIFKINEKTSEYSQIAKVTASDGVVGDEFGSSVAIMNGYLVVGSPKHNNSRGAVYIYKVAAQNLIAFLWTETSKIVKSSPAVNDLFGSNVKFFFSLNNSTSIPSIAVTCPGDDLTSPVVTDIGSISVFKENTLNVWTLSQTIKDTSGLNGEGRGMKLGMSRRTLIAWAKNPTSSSGKVSSVFYDDSTMLFTNLRSINIPEKILDFDVQNAVTSSFIYKCAVGLENKAMVISYSQSTNSWNFGNIYTPVGFTTSKYGCGVKFSRFDYDLGVRDCQNNYVAVYNGFETKFKQIIYFKDFTSNNYPKGSMLFYGKYLFLGDGGSSSTSPGKFYGLNVSFQF